MAVLRWDRMTWEEFLAAVEAYQREFSGRSEEDFEYLRCLRLLEGKQIEARAARARDLVRFLNAWKCGVNKDKTPPMLAAWMRENAERVEALEHLTIADPEVLQRLNEIQAVYDSLWTTARAEVRTWGPAATAKTLHQLVPGLFVMWDKNIERYADGYVDFMSEMHRLGTRMVAEGPYASEADLERGLQEHLEYGVRKTLAKYLDEFNWYVMVGEARVAVGD
jgi:hypothetical protein